VRGIRTRDARWRAAILVAFALCCSRCNGPLESLRTIQDALARGDLAEVERQVDPGYSDARGDRAVLLADLRDLIETYGAVKIRFPVLELQRAPGVAPTVIGTLEVELEGTPSVALVGPLRVEFARDRARVRSGLLDDLRDIRALLLARKAALESNDAAAFGRLLHPAYRDGDLDKDGALARIAEEVRGLPIRDALLHHRIEVRGTKAHVDERYQLTAGDRTFPESIARLTLERSAGRWQIQAGLFPAGG
jgi:hypothetical protein